jgi:AcrR family transcriptional regulator
MNEVKPRVKDKETRIEEIQNAARKVFFEKGYQSSTIEEIAKEAGVAKGTVYFYFENKDDLYMSLMEYTTDDLCERIIQFENETDHTKYKNGSQIIMGILNVLYEWYKADPDGFIITTTFQQGGLLSRMSQDTLGRLNELGRKGFRSMRRIILKAKRRGLIREGLNEIIVADSLYATFLGLTQFEENKKRVTKKDHIFETLNQAFTIIADGICTKAD